VHFFDCWGTREEKLNFLQVNDISSILWRAWLAGDWGNEFNQFSLANLDPSTVETYVSGISIRNLFRHKVMGVTTGRDADLVAFTREELLEQIRQNTEALGINSDLPPEDIDSFIVPYNYRPLDFRFLFNKPGVVNRDRHEIMQYLAGPQQVEGNVVIVTERFIRSMTAPHWNFIYATELIPDKSCISNQDNSHVYPLFIRTSGVPEANFYPEIIPFLQEHYGRPVSPEDLFYYIIGILGTPLFQARFSDLLVLDYPRVLFPQNPASFGQMATLGNQLARAYLLLEESPGTNFSHQRASPLPLKWSYTVDSVTYDEEQQRAWINGEEFLTVEPEIWAWLMGYFSPLADYLAHRRGRVLSPAEVAHVDRLIFNLRRLREVQSSLDDIFQGISGFLDCRPLLGQIIVGEAARLKLNRGTLFPLPFPQVYRKLATRLYVPDEAVVRQALHYD
jgi:predicted helicase